MRERILIPVLGFGQIVAFASSYYLLGVLADPIAEGTVASVPSLFAALSGAFLVSALVTPASGWAIESYGGRRVQVFAHVAFAFALFIMAAANTVPALWFGIVALGIGMGTGLYGTAFAIVVEKRGAEARRGITAVSLIGALGGGLGWPISRALVQVGDWRLACLAWGLTHLIICLPLTLWLLPKTAPRINEPQMKTPVAWDRRMIQMAGIFAGAWMVSTAMGAHLPRVLNALGMTASTAAWAAGLMAASAIAARVFDLVVMHRAHPLATVRFACLLHPAVAFCALSAPVAAPLLAVGQGAGNGLLSVASGVLPLQIFGPERYAVRQALLLTPARYLQAAAPAAYAWALDGSVMTALLLSSALCLGMLALTVGLVSKDHVGAQVGG
jgi:MFS family permease